MLKAMALGMMRQISANIQHTQFSTIMADETADVSNKEQLVICIRWVDDCFVIHEDFIGMHPLERTTADQIVAILKNALLRMNLNIQRARVQCYDGAATMAGEKTGVATQIKTINGKCLYTYCYGHALNLAVADYIKSVPCISDALDTVREIGKLVKKSPQRNTKLDKIRAETKNESRGVHAFCPTRWTVRGEALAAVINNHAELMELVANRVKRYGNKSKNTRCSKYDENVQFLFWLYPGRATSEADRQPKSRLARLIHLSCSR